MTSEIYLETNQYTNETYILTSTGERPVPVHKLVAVAEYGIDAVKENDVHHLNTISWDNRPENISLTENASEKTFSKRGYWKMVNGEPQRHIFGGTIKELAENNK